MARFAAGLPGYFRSTITADEAAAIVRRGMERRGETFLEMVERAVFGNPTSPYRALLAHAGCELGDIKSLVAAEGVEGALERLHRDGVYVTFEEFKGRAPARRGSQTFFFRDRDFDNPSVGAHFSGSSGGSSGRPTRLRVSLAHAAQQAPHWALWFAAHGVLASPLIFWTPFHAGMASRQLLCAKFGQRAVKWFTMASGGSLKDRAHSVLITLMVRRAGRLPAPEPAPLDEPWPIAEYLLRLLDQDTRPAVNTSPSAAVRIALAAQDRSRSLTGVTFLLGAEPLTRARKQTIESSGARAVPCYGFSEGGGVGAQCPAPREDDEVHVFLDAFAVIAHSRPAGDGSAVNAYLLTSLRPAVAKIMLNAEIGDFGFLEARRCGCTWDTLGWTTHLHTIRSFDKLTGEGVTFVGADLFRLLEEVLPRQFGGSVGDYQLLEEQDARGLPRYVIVVSPSVGAVDEAALREVFLEHLRRLRGWSHYALMADMWRQAGILQVRRAQPQATAQGKVFPFRTLAVR